MVDAVVEDYNKVSFYGSVHATYFLHRINVSCCHVKGVHEMSVCEGWKQVTIFLFFLPLPHYFIGIEEKEEGEKVLLVYRAKKSSALTFLPGLITDSRRGGGSKCLKKIKIFKYSMLSRIKNDTFLVWSCLIYCF